MSSGDISTYKLILVYLEVFQIRNEDIPNKVGVVLIGDKLKEWCLY
uniref:Uncharacterized protein n=1 Tax=Rhizophora mucronata TaxID=61149 RepID=A0A2P2NJ69_RHIMU